MKPKHPSPAPAPTPQPEAVQPSRGRTARWGTVGVVFVIALAAGIGAVRFQQPSAASAAAMHHAAASPTVPASHAMDEAAPPEQTLPALEVADEHASNVPVGTTNRPAAVAANALALGDTFLREGNPAAALKHFDSLPSAEPARFQDQLSYRRGLCAEALGDLDRAITEYRNAARDAGDASLMDRARLGQARVWARLERFDLAESILSAMWLISGDTPGRSASMRAEISHLLADVVSRQLTSREDSLLEEDGLLSPPFTWSDHLWTDALQPPSPAAAPENPPASGVSVLYRLSNRPDEIQLRVRLPRLSAPDLLQLIAVESAIPMEWSREAELSTVGRTLSLSVDDITLASLLDAALRPLGLVWLAREGRIRVTAASEWTAEDLDLFTAAVAKRSLIAAIYTYPDHVYTSASYLTLGNLAARRQRWDEARAGYEQLQRQFPRSPVSLEACFNLAKVHLIQNRFEESREQFLRSIDQGPGHPAESIAYLYVGRSFLEAGEPRRSMTHLSRALTLARRPDVQATAALLLSSAYLMAGNPEGANRLLMEQRPLLTSGQFHDEAAFLAGLARFRAALDDYTREREARSLVIACSHVAGRKLFSRHFGLLIGEALRDVGLPERMIELYTAELARPAIFPLRSAMILELAEARCEAGEEDVAAALYESLRQQDQLPWSRQASLRLADLYLNQKQYDAALAMARETLDASADDAEKIAALRLMGKVYERTGNRSAAALCFAGVNPGAAQPPGSTPVREIR